jgi:small subunit ribosomal protein S16
MDEPKEGATTMKKKAQEKLAAKANPAPAAEEVSEVVVEVSEPAATDVVAEVPAQAATTEDVVEAPVAEAPTEEAAAE